MQDKCGKTTTLRLLVRALEPTKGDILLHDNGKITNIAKSDKEELKKVRRKLRMVFQDPESSLNPRMTVRRIIGEPLVINNKLPAQDLDLGHKRHIHTKVCFALFHFVCFSSDYFHTPSLNDV